jgi:hypothetical protein
MRLVVAAGLVTFITQLAAAPLQAQGSLSASPFYPLKVGSTWHYRTGDGKITVKVTGHEKVGDELCARLEATEKDAVKIEYIAVRADGLYRTKIKDKEIKPALCFLKLPPQTDASWEVDCSVGGGKIRGKFIQENEEVTVPAGTFQTIRVSSKNFSIGNKKLPLTYWFAKGRGIVKQQVEISGVTLTLELEKFEPGP